MIKLLCGTIVLSIILIILFLIYKKKTDNYFICKECGTKTGVTDKVCKKCGTELNEIIRERVIKQSNKKFLMSIYAMLIVVIAMLSVYVLTYSKSGNIFYDLSGSTGVYMQKNDNTISTDKFWFVDCKALSNGILKKSVKNKEIHKIMAQGKTNSGILTLKVISGKQEKKYDISNTEGEIEIETDELSEDLIKFSITHSKSDHIYMKIRWE